MHKNRFFIHLFFSIILTGIGLISHAQENQSAKLSIKGNVVDDRNNAVADAAVVLLNKDSTFAKQVSTDKKGVYTFYNLVPGKYYLKVSASGYKPFRLNDIMFSGTKILTLTVTLTELISDKVSVSGIVTDISKAPLSGVAIAVKNKNVAITAADGKFSCLVSKESSLIFTSVGYQPFFYHAKDNTGNLSVILEAQVNTLDSVVVTALGIKRTARELGYATTEVKGEKLTETLSQTWSDALSGKVAGLNIIRSGGGPASSNKITLRGPFDLSGTNEALIVVDGVIMNNGSGRRTDVAGTSVYSTNNDYMATDFGSGINDINPEDIESINVLKGPGAAALYGQRAAGGAIIITTKSGLGRNRKFGVTVNSNYADESINRWPALQHEFAQGLGGANYYSYGASADGASTAGTSSAYGVKIAGQMVYQYDPAVDGQSLTRVPLRAYDNVRTDFFKHGHTWTNTVSLEGGGDKTSARFSFTNVKNDWIIPNTGYNRNSISMSVNSKLNDRLQITAKANYTNKYSDNLPGVGYGNQSIMYWFIFWHPDCDVNWLRDYWKQGQVGTSIKWPGSFSSYPHNPYAIAYEYLNGTNRNEVTGNVQAVYTIVKDFTLSVRVSEDMSYEARQQKRPWSASSVFAKGSYRTQNIFSNEVSGDFLLKYRKQINKDFSFTVMGGGSGLKNTYIKDETRADSLTFPGVYSFANAAGILVDIPYRSKYAINSFYGMANVAFKDYLYLDLTARNDWTSTLATPTRTDNVGFFYPSASLSFILSDAVKLPSVIDYAKFRLSTAGVGSGGTTPYLTSFSYASAGSLFAGGLTNPSQLINPNLTYSKTRTYETGFNVSMFKNRLNVDVALYTGNATNQILNRIVDQSSGYASAVMNAGSVRNQGIEIALNTVNVVTRNFKWSSGIVFSTNKNRIMSLADSSIVLQTGPLTSTGSQIVAKVGGSMGDLYGIGYLRSPDGQVVFSNTTGWATADPNIKYLGNTMPKIKIGFNNDFTFKQFHVHLLFDAQYGGVANSQTWNKMAEQGKLEATVPGRYNGIIGNGVMLDGSGKYVKNKTIATDIDYYYRNLWGANIAEGNTFSTDFIKFREARIDYSFKPSLIKKWGFARATIGAYGRDLFIWSPWPIFDPEFGTLSGTDIKQGFEVAQFPSTRTVGVNLILGF